MPAYPLWTAAADVGGTWHGAVVAVVEVPRPPRIGVVLPEVGELRVVAPPPAATQERGGLGQALLAGLGSLGMVGFALVGGNRLFLGLAVVLAVATLAGTLGTRRGQSRAAARRRLGQVDRWRAHVAARAGQARDAAHEQRAALERLHPVADALLARARGGGGRWERRPDDDHGWAVRIGTGAVPARLTLLAESLDAPLAETDPGLLAEAAAAVAAAAVLPAAPVIVDLHEARVLAVVGALDQARSFARAVVAELVCTRPPGELAVRLLTDEPTAWWWLAWLPHRVLLDDQPGTGEPELVVADGPAIPAGGREQVAVLRLVGSRAELPGDAEAVLDLVGRPRLVRDGPATELDTWAGLAPAAAEEVARALAPLRPVGERAAAGVRGDADVQLLDLLGIADPYRLDAAAGWAARPAGERLRAPLGVGDDGAPVVLDLREAAEGGDGPHGLVVGATGSGKSELLRALVAGLALRHAPSELAMVLVDWKGGAAFDEVSRLPHVAGLVTNLADDPALVDRVGAALGGELARRQRLLRAAGAESLRAYDGCRATGADLPPVPELLVVIDEFGELLAAQPELLDVLGAIGRLGRSLGVHLLLSSQRLEEGRLRGLESHLRYRVCLRVFTPAESSAVLGVPDAAHLPTRPGAGLLAVDGHRVRMQAAHTGATCQDRPGGPTVALVRPLRLGRPRPLGASAAAGAGAPSERAVLVDRVVAVRADQAHPVWLPPLPACVPLAPLLGGQLPAGPAEPGLARRLPLGLADLPASQRQPIWQFDLGRDGHLAVAGAPGAGASTLLRVVAAAAVHGASPHDVQLALLDFGGGGLQALDALPHTRCLAGPAEPDLAAALLRSLRALVEERAAESRRFGLDGAAGWRRARSEGRLAGTDAADVLVLLDGLRRAREELPTLDDDLTALASAGLRVGVHLVLAAQRWADVRPALRELLATRVELRLADPLDSLQPRGCAAALTAAPPGRAITTAGIIVQVADPAGVLERAARVATPGAAATRLLRLPALAEVADANVLGLREGDHAAVSWDGRGGLLVLGDRGSGRTTLLRRVLRAARATRAAGCSSWTRDGACCPMRRGPVSPGPRVVPTRRRPSPCSRPSWAPGSPPPDSAARSCWPVAGGRGRATWSSSTTRTCSRAACWGPR